MSATVTLQPAFFIALIKMAFCSGETLPNTVYLVAAFSTSTLEIGRVLALLLLSAMVSLPSSAPRPVPRPFLLAFAAGAMIYVVVEELIPESQNGKHSNIATIGVMLGFTLMMVLDVVLA